MISEWNCWVAKESSSVSFVFDKFQKLPSCLRPLSFELGFFVTFFCHHQTFVYQCHRLKHSSQRIGVFNLLGESLSARWKKKCGCVSMFTGGCLCVSVSVGRALSGRRGEWGVTIATSLLFLAITKQ